MNMLHADNLNGVRLLDGIEFDDNEDTEHHEATAGRGLVGVPVFIVIFAVFAYLGTLLPW